jgi:hypothetical protein
VKVLGLDISTSVVGYAIVETDDMSLVELGHWSLKKHEGLIKKADVVLDALAALFRRHTITAPVWIEEPVMRFTPGMSSAQTISMLIGFNAMVTYGVHSKVNFDVKHVKPGDARRSCGLIMTTKAKSGGLSQKEQTFSQLTAPGGLLSTVSFPLTKTGKQKPENYDQSDAYVVARHGGLASRA